MTEEQHIQCEIEEFKIEMQRHRDAIQNCIKLVKRNNEKLRKLKQMKDAQRNTNEAVENKLKKATDMTIDEMVEMSYRQAGYDEETIQKLQNNNCKIQMKNARYPVLEVIDENTVKIEGVEYKKVLKEKTPTIYEFLIQCAYGEWNPDLVDTEIQIQIETNAENFVNYLYEYCDVIEEDDDKMIVSISKTQMVIPND
jgi:ribosomal protein L16 Arg81 hydroxylase